MRTGITGLAAAFALAACTSTPPTQAPAQALAAAPAQTPASAQAPAVPFAAIGQLVVVTTASWDTTDARLGLYEQEPQRGAWTAILKDVPAVVGKNGLAWGRGLPLDAQAAGAGGPTKREGDGRSPAGLFAVGTAFGFDEASRLSLPYRRLTPGTECVDDSQSRRYNTLVERAAVAVDWTSSEKMRDEPLYRIGAFIQHNAPDVVPGAGSCIFLHIWSGPGRGTAGCTAMDEAALAALLGALDPEKSPALLQVPRAVYDALEARHGLP